MQTSLRPKSGITAAQLAVLRSTGLTMSHAAAVHHLRGENALARTELPRIVGTVSPADAINGATRSTAIEPAPHTCSPKQTGCNLNCAQGHRCTCTGSPMPHLAPRATRRATSRIEQRASDFGVLDLTHREDDASAEEIADKMTRRGAVMARVYRWGWRAALIGAIGLVLAGCGGGDDHGDQFEPALAMPRGVALVGDNIPGATVAFTATAADHRIVMVNHIGPQGTGTAAAEKTRDDCETAKRKGQTCVVIRTGADGMGAEISKWLLTEELGLVLCDLTAFPDIDDTLIRCAHDAASRRTTL